MGLFKSKNKIKKMPKKVLLKQLITKYIFLALGATIAAFAIEGFLVPNQMIDGGVIGISMIISHVTKINLGILVVLINAPFVALAFQRMGKKFVIQTLYAVAIFALMLNVFHPVNATQDHLLATVFGGVILGTGVGLILRNEAALDGTEILALRLAKNLGFSVGEIIMFFNVFIYSTAGFVYGWNNAMYSILTYFIAYKVIDIVIEGLNSSKSIRIISDKYKEIGNAIIEQLDTSVTYLRGKGGYSGQEKIITFCVVSRLEITKIKDLTKSIDPTAFLVVNDVHEVEGVRVKKNSLLNTGHKKKNNIK